MPKKKKKKKAKILKKTKISKIKSKTESKLVEKKSSNFGAEEKPEIKKIKKQPTEKRIYNVKDYVVYPKHGVGKITAVEKAKIGEIDIQFYKILVEKEKLTLTVPINQQSKLRPISSINQINKCISILKTKPKIKRTMWSRRAQEYDQKINSGDIKLLSEVVRDLFRKDDQTEQSYSERQMFQVAFERYTREFAISSDLKFDEASAKILEILNKR